MKRLFSYAMFVMGMATGLVPFFVNAQDPKSITGKVTDEKSGQPVPGCSVYFSNTSKGDISDAKGNFTLSNLPAGNYELVVSAIGYKTEVMPVSSNNYPHNIHIVLKILSAELSEVIVQPALRNGWEKWGQFFVENFIGTTANSFQCRLVNHEALKFWFSEKTNKLTARADEPLIVENEALGYTIKFKLEEFTSDYNKEMVIYLGYPLFQEMTSTNPKKKSKWKENREKAYYGSLLHFMRNVYNERWLESGYHIVTNVKRLNLEKQRVAALFLKTTPQANTGMPVQQTAGGPRDSTAYFKKILKQPDTLSTYTSLTNLDSMLVLNDDLSKSLFFEDKLDILYKRYPQSNAVQSEIFLSTPEAIRIDENGRYSSPRELVTTMHWAQWEKIANLLPFDYQP